MTSGLLWDERCKVWGYVGNQPSEKMPPNADKLKASLTHWPKVNKTRLIFSFLWLSIFFCFFWKTREKKKCKAFNSFISPVPRPQKSQLVKSFRSAFFINSPHRKSLRCLRVLFIFSKYWIQFAVKSFVSIKFACRSSRTCLLPTLEHRSKQTPIF